MDAKIVENLIVKYLDGRASLEEINQLDTWYNSFDAQGCLYVPGSMELRQVLANKFSELSSKLGINQVSALT